MRKISNMIMTSDEREVCRSLVCDSNGIIIAEMVYRCMICAYISDSIGDAQRHYQIRHMDTDVVQSPSSTTLTTSHTSHHLHHTKPEPLDSLDDEEEDDSEEMEPTGSTSPSNARGGFVTYAVCHITKFYASVQRRYGQFTCMGCAKFFGRFLIKPRKYCCPNLGNCPLDATPRCKACLLQACIDTYQIDEKRMKIVNLNRPVRKSIVSRQASSSNNNNTPSHEVNSSNQSSSLPITNISTNSLGLNPSTNSSTNNGTSGLLDPAKSSILGQQLTSSSSANSSSTSSSALSPATGSSSSASTSRARSSSSSNTAVLALLRSTGKKNWGCRKCAGCLVEDCGKCNYCLDKPKFGGANTLKKKCIQRKCLLQEQQKLEQAQNSLRNALK